MPTTSVTALIRLGTAFYDAQTLLTGVELGVFSRLAGRPSTAETLQTELGLHSKSFYDFLDALVALEVLEKSGRLYQNSPAAELYLDQEKDTYIGNFLKFNQSMLYPTWQRLAETLRTGESQLGKLMPGVEDPFAMLYSMEDRLRGFAAGMDGFINDIGSALAKEFPWGDHATFVDLGGARGGLAAALVSAHPHLRGVTFDLAPMEPLFNEKIVAEGVQERVSFQAGDFFTTTIPNGDVLIFGHVLHDWPAEHRQTLIKRAADAMRPEGTLLIYDTMIDEGRREKAFSLLMSLNMALTVGASEYTVGDCRSWIHNAGLEFETARPLNDRDTLVTARKRV